MLVNLHKSGIHFIFQHVRGFAREQLYQKCFDSWKDTFVENDTLCFYTSNGIFPLKNIRCKTKKIYNFNSPNIVLAVKKRNMGIAISENEYVMLIDDDILLTEKDWRDRLNNAINELSVEKKQEAFFSLAPATGHIWDKKISVKDDVWFDMRRMGMNCFVGRSAVFKSIPFLNHAISADKTYIDFIYTKTNIKLYRHGTGLIDHTMPPEKRIFHNLKYREIRRHKHDWYRSMMGVIASMRKVLNDFVGKKLTV